MEKSKGNDEKIKIIEELKELKKEVVEEPINELEDRNSNIVEEEMFSEESMEDIDNSLNLYSEEVYPSFMLKEDPTAFDKRTLFKLDDLKEEAPRGGKSSNKLYSPNPKSFYSENSTKLYSEIEKEEFDPSIYEQSSLTSFYNDKNKNPFYVSSNEMEEPKTEEEIRPVSGLEKNMVPGKKEERDLMFRS